MQAKYFFDFMLNGFLVKQTLSLYKTRWDYARNLKICTILERLVYILVYIHFGIQTLAFFAKKNTKKQVFNQKCSTYFRTNSMSDVKVFLIMFSVLVR